MGQHHRRAPGCWTPLAARHEEVVWQVGLLQPPVERCCWVHVRVGGLPATAAVVRSCMNKLPGGLAACAVSLRGDSQPRCLPGSLLLGLYDGTFFRYKGCQVAAERVLHAPPGPSLAHRWEPSDPQYLASAPHISLNS